jgi:hypothetical protein
MPDVSSLRVLYATEEELQSHESTLAAIDKESKGKLVWKLPEAQA